MRADVGPPLVLDAAIYADDPAWWVAHALLAGARLRVERGPGRGWSELEPDGGYAHVCTRRDLAGAELGRWT